MIDQVLKVFKAINSEVGPWQISFAAALAMVIGLTPLWSIHNIIILLVVFIFRIHLATFFVFWAVFSGIAYLLDPWFHDIGLFWLGQTNLQTLWTGMYQNDFWLVTHFNHSITLGSLFVTAVAFIPAAIIFRLSIVKYRVTMMPWVGKLKVVQVLKGSRLYELYEKLEG